MLKSLLALTIALTCIMPEADAQFGDPFKSLRDAGKRLDKSRRVESGRASEYIRDRRIAVPRDEGTPISIVPQRQRTVRGYVSVRNTTGRSINYQIRSRGSIATGTIRRSSLQREKLYGNDTIRFDWMPRFTGYQAKQYSVRPNQTVTFRNDANGNIVVSAGSGYVKPAKINQQGNTTFLQQGRQIQTQQQQPKRDNTADAIAAGIGLLGELLKNAPESQPRERRQRRNRR